jgi:hypothetical protein
MRAKTAGKLKAIAVLTHPLRPVNQSKEPLFTPLRYFFLASIVFSKYYHRRHFHDEYQKFFGMGASSRLHFAERGIEEHNNAVS